MPRRPAAAHHLLDLGTDNVPDFGPALASALPECARMALGSHGLAIGVVIKLNELWTPPDEHRVVGIQQDAQCGPQALRPVLRRPQRIGGPIVRPRQRAHFAAASEKIPEVGRLIFSIQDDRWRVQPNWQPELNRLSQSQQTDGPAFGSKYIFWTEQNRRVRAHQ